MPYDYPVTYRPDLIAHMKTMKLDDSKPAVQPRVKLDKDQVNACRKAHARWVAHTTGNAYMLYLVNRTSSHAFRVQAYGKTPVDAVKRWYRGLDGNDTWKRQCVKVVAVHACADPNTSQAGDLLMGTQQNSFPY